MFESEVTRDNPTLLGRSWADGFITILDLRSATVNGQFSATGDVGDVALVALEDVDDDATGDVEDVVALAALEEWLVDDEATGDVRDALRARVSSYKKHHNNEYVYR